jgi:hypothetical protein
MAHYDVYLEQQLLRYVGIHELCEKTSAKRNSGRKSTLTERDRRTLRRIVYKNHRTIAAQATAELNNHLDEHVSTNLSDMSLTNPTSTVELELLNF